jgi:NitT/TauT family transport system permease protein
MPAIEQTMHGVTADDAIQAELAGLDALELRVGPGRGRAARLWSAAWPKLAATALGLFLWQVVFWSGWRPDYALPPPTKVLPDLWDLLRDGKLTTAVGITMRRAALGFALAIAIGVAVGSVVSRVHLLRVAFGSLITGLQTMPSIAWFPLALVLFKISEGAITFVIVLGAAPAIANGLISGVDHIPPLLLRAGRVLGARRLTLYRHVILPASLPSFVAGLKQGWAFAWRSLMAGELLVIIANKQSIGNLLQEARTFADVSELMAVMLVILVIGIAIDSLCFGTLERSIRRRWGLLESSR